jgi:UDP-glucose 4-epimerase
MKVLVTGGAGFIGRWVVGRLLARKEEVWVLDDFSNGSGANLEEFRGNPKLKEVLKGDVADETLVAGIFARTKFDACIHLAAQINVQASIDNPRRDFEVNVVGTRNVLEGCRKNGTRLVLVSTCMVYDTAGSKAIGETHAVNPASPYAASKLSAENMALAYYHTYGLPVVVLRPFNTYGPFQKSNMEGGVISIFIRRAMKGEDLLVFGTGEQTRDLLYVEDCAEFVEKALYAGKKADGQVFNAGLGKDIRIRDLAVLVAGGKKEKVKFVEHHHPQSEIMKLLCNPAKAGKALGWKPRTGIQLGIEKTKKWIAASEKY